MKKQIIIAVCLLSILFIGCAKKSNSSTSSTPVSTFNITFNGKTINVTSASANMIYAITGNGTGGDLVIRSWTGGSTVGVPSFTSSVSIQDTKVDATIMGRKLDLSTAVGTYTLGGYSTASGDYSVQYGSIEITDNTDGGKFYTCYQDTTSSSVTVTVSNSTEVKGTFTALLTYNGTTYPATGDFDYKH